MIFPTTMSFCDILLIQGFNLFYPVFMRFEPCLSCCQAVDLGTIEEGKGMKGEILLVFLPKYACDTAPKIPAN
jgi:hypothetical protein